LLHAPPARAASPRASLTRVAAVAVAAAWLAAGVACSTFVKPTLPGETEIGIRSLTIEPTAGQDRLALDWSPLKPTLSVRPTILIIAGQPYNPYRKAEDARRIVAFWQGHGYFDARVADAEIEVDEEAGVADVVWRVHEGPAYSVREVVVTGAPTGWEARLRGHIPFASGADVRVEPYRWVRHRMVDALRRAGWLRAEVYSRAFVDRETKQVDWHYLVDPGPRSVVGQITVHGHDRVSERAILDRVRLRSGEAIDFDRVEKLERDLLDVGSFNTARLHAEYGTEFVMDAVPPDSWIPPDTGGLLRPEQVGPDGSFRPREGLASEVDLAIHVVEAPSVQTRIGAGINIDLERVDPYAGLGFQFRDLFGSFHHLVLEGSAGYGLRWRGDVEEPLGVYGSALIRYVKAGFLGRIVDLRVTARFDESLYPGFHWRTASAGAALRATLDRGLLFEIEPRARFDWPVGVGAIDPAVAEDLRLITPDRTLNAELAASLVWDARNDGFEPMSGHLVALRAAWAPGGPLGDSSWLRAELDLRYIAGLSPDLAIGFRAAPSWVFATGDDGVPIGARLFGGGAYGVRGFGHRRLAPYAEACREPDSCQRIPVGAMGLFESSLELRWLPFRQQIGATLFADLGGASATANPFEDGVTVSVGAGLRVRTWHIPVALDFAYRVTSDSAWGGLDRFHVFFRIGEAF